MSDRESRMAAWLIIGSITLAALLGLAWVWALCRAAAIGDRARRRR